MKIFKCSFLAIATLLGSYNYSSAQEHEVKANVLLALFESYNVGYEYIFAEDMGVNINIGYATSPFGINLEGYSSFSVAADFRYYFNPNYDGDGYFASGYLKSISQSDSYQNFNDETVERDAFGLALGFTFGRKWVTRSGFTFETFTGVGRLLVQNVNYSDDNNNMATLDDFWRWDVRIGVSVGYRF